MNSFLFNVFILGSLWIIGYGLGVIVKQRFFASGTSSTNADAPYSAILEFVQATKVTNQAISAYTDAVEAGNPPPDKRSIAGPIASMLALYANEICGEKTMLKDMEEVIIRTKSVMDLLREIGFDIKGNAEAGERWATDLVDMAIMELDLNGRLVNPEKIQNPAKLYYSTS